MKLFRWGCSLAVVLSRRLSKSIRDQSVVLVVRTRGPSQAYPEHP